jgi:FKBP-type peptidyl-prolyl cis-trans isomerase FkpA
MSRGAAAPPLRFILLACAGLFMAACSREAPAPPPGAPAVAGVAELQVKDLVPGDGVEAVPGSRVTVHYTGWLYDPAQPEAKGRKFDSSRDAGQPFSFKLGARQVIAGWDQGVQGMKVGGQRELVIPAALAYGERGAGGVIPPGATLVFDVQLLDVAPPR